MRLAGRLRRFRRGPSSGLAAIAAELWLADPEALARERAMAHLPASRVVADYRAVLDHVGLVDVVTPTAQHVAPGPRHERHADGSWQPVFGDAIIPKLEPRGPVEILASQFAEFLGHVEHRTAPEADVQRCGVDIALLLQAITSSARSKRAVACAGGCASGTFPPR